MPDGQFGANGCTADVPYCINGTEPVPVCSACTGIDNHSTCIYTNSTGPYCVSAFTQSGLACAACSLNVTNSCKGNQTCGTPSCIADYPVYCSVNHDADHRCSQIFN